MSAARRSPALGQEVSWAPAYEQRNVEIQSGSYFDRYERPNDIDRVVIHLVHATHEN